MSTEVIYILKRVIFKLLVLAWKKAIYMCLKSGVKLFSMLFPSIGFGTKGTLPFALEVIYIFKTCVKLFCKLFWTTSVGTKGALPLHGVNNSLQKVIACLQGACCFPRRIPATEVKLVLIEPCRFCFSHQLPVCTFSRSCGKTEWHTVSYVC